MVRGCAFAVVVCGDKTRLFDGDRENGGFWVQDCSAASENMLLAATAEGLGTVFHIPVADEVEKIKEIVGAPEDYEFTCLLTMGYPAKDAFLPKQKQINVEDRIHINAW